MLINSSRVVIPIIVIESQLDLSSGRSHHHCDLTIAIAHHVSWDMVSTVVSESRPH